MSIALPTSTPTSHRPRLTGLRGVLCSLVLGLIATVAAAQPALAASQIADGGEFFSPAARTEALDRLKALEAKTGHEVQIETFTALPEPWKGQLAAGKPKQQIYVDFTKDRGQLTHAKGLFVVIVKDPAHLEVAADRRLRDAGFSSSQRDEVAKTLLSGFRAKDYDAALLAAVGTMEKEFTTVAKPGAQVAKSGAQRAAAPHQSGAVPAHRANPAAANGLGGWGSVIVIGGLIFAVIIGFGLIRALFGGGGGAAAGAGMGGGGMGFGGSLLTGLFGAMAGHYLYDTFFNSHSHGNAFGNDSPTGAGDDWNRNDLGSGGDFGDSSGFSGGDFGGGDSFGGDF